MFRSNPIGRDFVPYTKRLALPGNEDLFVDGGSGASHGQTVKLQDFACSGVECGDPCRTGIGICDRNGICVVGRPVNCP